VSKGDTSSLRLLDCRTVVLSVWMLLYPCTVCGLSPSNPVKGVPAVAEHWVLC
jgi:hypothetical protein